MGRQPPSSQPPAPMVVVSHNAFWGQGFPYPGASPGEPVAAVLDGLVAVYRRLAPDCLCLQEIQSADMALRLGAALNLGVRWCPGGRLSQYGLAVLARDLGAASDWRDAGPVPERGWLMVRTAGLLVANVHLPSERYLGAERACAARCEEMAMILGHGPDLIAGDHNEPPGGALSRLLTVHGYVDLAVATSTAHLPTIPGGTPRHRIDYVWARQGIANARSLRYAVLAEADMAAPADCGRVLLSDHFPVSACLV